MYFVPALDIKILVLENTMSIEDNFYKLAIVKAKWDEVFHIFNLIGVIICFLQNCSVLWKLSQN